MTGAELIVRAKREGLAFTIEGDKIKCRLPKPAGPKIKALLDELRQHKDEVIESLKLEAGHSFPGAHQAKTISCDIEAGEIVAVEIDSTVLGANIWLAFRDDFNPGDGKAVFYGHELPALRNKTPAELREIHKVKLAFGPGSKVKQ